MNRFLINCAWDIMDLGKANGVDNSVARDMFCENLATFGTDAFPNYPGAEVDYAALSAAWQAMDKAEQADAKISCANFMKDCYDAISETRRVGSPAKFYDIAAHYEMAEQAKPSYILYTHAWDIWDRAEADGTDLQTAKATCIETLEGWADLTDGEKTAENTWFDAKVVPYDQGLKYARLTGNRALFEAVLAAR